MAEAPVDDIYEKLKDAITCSICLEKTTTPKFLTCHHTFCLKCIQAAYNEAIKKNQTVTGQLRCPYCTSITTVTSDDLSSLPSDFRVNQLDDILKTIKLTDDKDSCCSICQTKGTKVDAAIFCFNCTRAMCKQCLKAHEKNPRMKTHAYSSIRPQEIKTLVCSAHKEYFQAFCTDCWEPVCQDCILITHDKHTVQDLVRRTNTDGQLLTTIKEHQLEMDRTVNMLDYTKKEQQTRSQSAKDIIHQYKLQIIKELDEQEKVLCDKIDKDEADLTQVLSDLTNTVNGKQDMLCSLQTRIERVEHPVPSTPGVTLADKETFERAVSAKIPDCSHKVPNCHCYNFMPDKGKVALGQIDIDKIGVNKKAVGSGACQKGCQVSSSQPHLCKHTEGAALQSLYDQSRTISNISSLSSSEKEDRKWKTIDNIMSKHGKSSAASSLTKKTTQPRPGSGRAGNGGRMTRSYPCVGQKSCPICSQIFNISQEEFELHVDTHFEHQD